MHDLDHRNVMSLVGVYFIKSDPCIVMPYMENGSLLTHLKKERQNLIVSETASEQVSFNIIILLYWEISFVMSQSYSRVISIMRMWSCHVITGATDFQDTTRLESTGDIT